MPGGFSRYRGGFARPAGGFTQSRGGFAQSKGGFASSDGNWLPTQISGLVDWHRSDMGITLVGSNVSAWADQSGLAHDLSQGTDANRFTYVTGIIGAHPVLRPPDATTRMEWTPWAQGTVSTVYAVIRYVATGATNQVLIYPTGDAGVRPFINLGGAGDKPSLLSSASDTATWGSALTNAQAYLIKWSWNYDGASSVLAVQVNNGTEVTTAPVTEATLNWQFLGLRSDLASWGIQSDLAELAVYNKRTSTTEDAAFWAYARARYGL